jgi:SAM-dependent methyltransferase
MWSDVVDLRDFYSSSLGYVARRAIGRRLRDMWPDVAGQRLLGLGYATPFLGSFLGKAERVLAVMPAAQGVLPWPPEGPNATSLCDEVDLPMPDLSMDRVLLVHALEHAESLRPFLREVWRVLAPSGRLIVVVPNRRGLWARFDSTPFGHGHPYTGSQLSRLLRDNLFTPVQTRTALFIPPFAWRLWLTSAGAWEQVGERWLTRFSGVVLMEAGKQIYAPTPVRPTALRAKRLRPQPALGSPAHLLPR